LASEPASSPKKARKSIRGKKKGDNHLSALAEVEEGEEEEDSSEEGEGESDEERKHD